MAQDRAGPALRLSVKGRADVPEPIYQCIVGHARAGVTQQVYLREGFTLRQLSEAIEKFGV